MCARATSPPAGGGTGGRGYGWAWLVLWGLAWVGAGAGAGGGAGERGWCLVVCVVVWAGVGSVMWVGGWAVVRLGADGGVGGGVGGGVCGCRPLPARIAPPPTPPIAARLPTAPTPTPFLASCSPSFTSSPRSASSPRTPCSPRSPRSLARLVQLNHLAHLVTLKEVRRSWPPATWRVHMIACIGAGAAPGARRCVRALRARRAHLKKCRRRAGALGERMTAFESTRERGGV